MKSLSNGKALVILLSLACAGWVAFITLRTPMATVVILPFPSQQQRAPPRCSIIADRWLVWLRSHLPGAKALTLTATILDFKSPSLLPNLTLPNAEFSNTNGVQAWIVNETELTTLRRRMEQTPGIDLVAIPKVTTRDGIQSQMFLGETVFIDGTNQSVGLVWNCLPHLRRDSTDLTSILTSTQAVTNGTAGTAELPWTNAISIRTNVAIAARFQIPKGNSVFLLIDDRHLTHGKITGVLISWTVSESIR